MWEALRVVPWIVVYVREKTEHKNLVKIPLRFKKDFQTFVSTMDFTNRVAIDRKPYSLFL